MQKAGAQAGMGVKLPLEAFGEAIKKINDFCLQKSFIFSQKAESEHVCTIFSREHFRFLLSMILYFSDNLPDFLGNSLNIFACINSDDFHAAFTG